MYPLEPGELPEIRQDEYHLDTSAFYRQFSQNRCDVKALNAVFTYQDEYLGNRWGSLCHHFSDDLVLLLF